MANNGVAKHIPVVLVQAVGVETSVPCCCVWCAVVNAGTENAPATSPPDVASMAEGALHDVSGSPHDSGATRNSVIVCVIPQLLRGLVGAPIVGIVKIGAGCCGTAGALVAAGCGAASENSNDGAGAVVVVVALEVIVLLLSSSAGKSCAAALVMVTGHCREAVHPARADMSGIYAEVVVIMCGIGDAVHRELPTAAAVVVVGEDGPGVEDETTLLLQPPLATVPPLPNKGLSIRPHCCWFWGDDDEEHACWCCCV